MSLEVEVGKQLVSEAKLVAVYRALDFELAGSIEAGGSLLLGISAKMSAWDCLLTIRVDQGGSRMICFVGSDSLVNCLLKAVRDAQNDMLRWRADKF